MKVKRLPTGKLYRSIFNDEARARHASCRDGDHFFLTHSRTPALYPSRLCFHNNGGLINDS